LFFFTYFSLQGNTGRKASQEAEFTDSAKLMHSGKDSSGYTKGNADSHRYRSTGDYDVEKEMRAHENGEIEADEVSNFDEQIPGDDYEPEFVDGEHGDPELYTRDNE